MLLGFVIPVSTRLVGVLALMTCYVLIIIKFSSAMTSVHVNVSVVHAPSLSTSDGLRPTRSGI